MWLPRVWLPRTQLQLPLAPVPRKQTSRHSLRRDVWRTYKGLLPQPLCSWHASESGTAARQPRSRFPPAPLRLHATPCAVLCAASLSHLPLGQRGELSLLQGPPGHGRAIFLAPPRRTSAPRVHTHLARTQPLNPGCGMLVPVASALALASLAKHFPNALTYRLAQRH